MSNEMTYAEWQRLRGEMRAKEEAERSEDLGSARPPLQVSVTDQILRQIIKEVRDAQEEIHILSRKVEALVSRPVPQVRRTED